MNSHITIEPIPGIRVDFRYSRTVMATAASNAAYDAAFYLLGFVEAFFQFSIQTGRATRQEFESAVEATREATLDVVAAIFWFCYLNAEATKLSHQNVREVLRVRAARTFWKVLNGATAPLIELQGKVETKLQPVRLFLTTAD